jgi:hypothetical protein
MTNTKAASPLAASGTDSGPPAVTRSFPGFPGSASAARSWVAGFLPGSPAADDAALMTSEPPSVTGRRYGGPYECPAGQRPYGYAASQPVGL